MPVGNLKTEPNRLVVSPQTDTHGHTAWR